MNLILKIIGKLLNISKKLRPYFAVFLALVGLFEILLSYLSCKTAHFKYSINDPGKSIFHIVLLPVSMYVFFSVIPYLQKVFKQDEITNAIKFRNILKIVPGILALFILCIMWFEVDIFHVAPNSQTYLLPHDVVDSRVRGDLILLRDTIESELDSMSDRKRNNQIAQWKLDSSKVQSQKDRYLRKLKDEKETESRSPIKIPLHTWVNWTETFLAACCGALILFTLFIGIYVNRETDDLDLANSIIKACIVAALILLPELVLRLYSDSYIAFFDISLLNIAISLIIFSVFFTFFIYYLFSQEERVAASIVTAITSIHGVVLALMGLKVGIFEDLLYRASNLAVPVKIIVILIMFLPLIVFMFFSDRKK